MDFYDQAYRQYSHIVMVCSTLESSRDCLRKRERCTYQLACRGHCHQLSQEISADAEIDFVSCLEQHRKRQDVIGRTCGYEILATN
jgi:hypothetical protein